MTRLIILQSEGLSRVLSSTTIQHLPFFSVQFSLWSTFTSYMAIGNTITLSIWTFVGKVISLLFNTLSVKVSKCVSHSVMSDSLRPHRLQSTRLLCSWDSPGKNTGVGCHSLLQGNTLSRFVILSLPRRKHLLISWLQRSLLNNWPYLLRLFQETRQKSMFTYFLAACLLSCHCNCKNQKEVATRNGNFSCFFFFLF